MIGTVLHILGIVLLVLLGFVLLAGLLLACLPIRIQVRRKKEGPPIRLRLCFGPLHITKRLGGKKKTAKKAATKKKSTTEKKQTTPRIPRADWKRLELEDVLAVMFPIMDDLIGTMMIDRLHVTVIFHRPDAAQTGKLLGVASALSGLLYPELARRFVLRDTNIVLDADFEAEQTVWSIDSSITTKLIRYPRVLWRNRRGLWNLWKSVRLSPEEREQWQPKQNKEEKE